MGQNLRATRGILNILPRVARSTKKHAAGTTRRIKRRQEKRRDLNKFIKRRPKNHIVVPTRNAAQIVKNKKGLIKPQAQHNNYPKINPLDLMSQIMY